MKMIMAPGLDVVLQTAKESHKFLAAQQLCHVIIGGLAVYLHGDANRRPRDVDLLIRPADPDRIGQTLKAAQFCWHDFRKAYCSPNGVRVEAHWDGKETRNGKLQLPDPALIQADVFNGLPVIALAHLIDTKLQCELQTKPGKICDPKHRGDILTLIRLKHLEESYADRLSSAVRDSFRAIVRQSRLSENHQ